MNSAQPGTLTFLFSDIEGSTRLLDELGSEVYTLVLERQAAILRAAFEEHGGREEGTEGDSFFVVFESAREALLAAVEGQRALAAEPWPAGVGVNVRMGLHAGEASSSAAGLVGLDIHLAARIAAAAHGGQIVVSEAVRTLVTPTLEPGVSLRGLGRHRLKDLREPQPLCQVVADGLRMEFPPLRSLDARPNNLPTQLTSFVGREKELDTAGRLLEANRLVTLTGPGGTGKTRLSLQVAANAAERYPDGVFFVPLETVREPSLVVTRIASAIGLAEAGGRTADVVLRDWLAGKQVLLVLDNFEQVLGAGPALAELLRDAPTLSALVTSRAALRVSGEQEFPVSGLPTPPDLSQLTSLELAALPLSERTIDAASLSTFESVRLFIARATAVRPDFRVTNKNAPAVAAIAAQLHGLPLAIELAAARIKLFSPEALRSRLEDQLGLLSAGARDLPERQRTLRGAIAWSCELLDDGHRRLLDRLSVFEGGLDIGAAASVCGPASEVGVDVFDGLVALADQSLIRTVDVGGDPRFEMLETIRAYAAEQLAARGETEAIAERHAAWFLALTQQLAPELAGTDQRTHLDRLELEHDNVRAVLDRATAAGDGAMAIDLAFAVWRFWQKRGYLSEARRRLDVMIAAPWSRVDPVRRARLLEAFGGVCWWQADIRAMGRAYLEAVGIWRSIGDKAELANALYNYAFVFTVPDHPGAEIGEIDTFGEGVQALEEALHLYEELDDARGIANVRWGMGNQKYFGDTADAGVDDFRAALEGFRQVGDRTMEAWSLHMLGGALLRREQPDESRPYLREALRHFFEAGDAAGITMVVDDLSSQALADEDHVRAARLWGAARALTAATGAGLAGFTDGWIEQKVRPNVRVALDPAELERGAQEGAAMPVDEAVAYALDTTVEDLRAGAFDPADHVAAHAPPGGSSGTSAPDAPRSAAD
ncbi:MAG TPA: adenylate/guanylate cyclase domain-containing protein [Candidatus Limnocylindria bacterium]|nr:adenylate/guanylate cyclase domain-containing protein [Candidatus Limnocylindria bacterium]